MALFNWRNSYGSQGIPGLRHLAGSLEGVGKRVAESEFRRKVRESTDPDIQELSHFADVLAPEDMATLIVKGKLFRRQQKELSDREAAEEKGRQSRFEAEQQAKEAEASTKRLFEGQESFLKRTDEARQMYEKQRFESGEAEKKRAFDREEADRKMAADVEKEKLRFKGRKQIEKIKASSPSSADARSAKKLDTEINLLRGQFASHENPEVKDLAVMLDRVRSGEMDPEEFMKTATERIARATQGEAFPPDFFGQPAMRSLQTFADQVRGQRQTAAPVPQGAPAPSPGPQTPVQGGDQGQGAGPRPSVQDAVRRIGQKVTEGADPAAVQGILARLNDEDPQALLELGLIRGEGAEVAQYLAPMMPMFGQIQQREQFNPVNMSGKRVNLKSLRQAFLNPGIAAQEELEAPMALAIPGAYEAPQGSMIKTWLPNEERAMNFLRWAMAHGR